MTAHDMLAGLVADWRNAEDVRLANADRTSSEVASAHERGYARALAACADRLESTLAQPSGEAVAWTNRPSLERMNKTGYVEMWKEPRHDRTVPLYTTPPAPLGGLTLDALQPLAESIVKLVQEAPATKHHSTLLVDVMERLMPYTDARRLTAPADGGLTEGEERALRDAEWLCKDQPATNPCRIVCAALRRLTAPRAEGDGIALILSREDAGIVMDALIDHREASRERKLSNAHSSSNLRADTCAKLIEQIGALTAAAPKVGAPQAEAGEVREGLQYVKQVVAQRLDNATARVLLDKCNAAIEALAQPAAQGGDGWRELRSPEEIAAAFATGERVEVCDPVYRVPDTWVPADAGNPDYIRAARIAQGYRYRALAPQRSERGE